MSALDKLKSEQLRSEKENTLETLSRAAHRTQLCEFALQDATEFYFEIPFADFKLEDECSAISRALCPTKSKLFEATRSSKAKAIPKKSGPQQSCNSS